jgi:hypothetical protein
LWRRSWRGPPRVVRGLIVIFLNKTGLNTDFIHKRLIAFGIFGCFGVEFRLD